MLEINRKCNNCFGGKGNDRGNDQARSCGKESYRNLKRNTASLLLIFEDMANLTNP